MPGVPVLTDLWMSEVIIFFFREHHLFLANVCVSVRYCSRGHNKFSQDKVHGRSSQVLRCEGEGKIESTDNVRPKGQRFKQKGNEVFLNIFTLVLGVDLARLSHKTSPDCQVVKLSTRQFRIL